MTNKRENEALIPEPKTEIISIERVEDLISIAQQRIEVVPRLVDLSLKVTNYRDWVNQGEGPYLVHSGAEKIARLFGIKILNVDTKKEWAKDTRGEYYIYRTTGTVALPGTIDSIEAMGTCSQRDAFFAKAKGEWLDSIEVDETNIMKASYSNFVVNGITHLLGLRNLTWEQVIKAGIDKSKVLKVDYQSGSQKVEATDTEKNTQKKLWNLLLQITGGDETRARDLLKEQSGFTSKKDKKKIEGKTDVKYLTGKWLNFTYKKIKEMAEQQGFTEEAVEEETPEEREPGQEG